MFCAGCSSEVETRLKQADGLVEEQPAKALAMLDTMNRADIGKSEQAYYSLLYTQAQIRSGVQVSSDSLIKIAYKHYYLGGDYSKRIRTFFYNAKVLYNNNELGNSVKNALAAYDLAEEQDDYYWQGKSAQLISDIYYRLHSLALAKKYLQLAIANFKKAHNDEYLHAALHSFKLMCKNETYTKVGEGQRYDLNNIMHLIADDEDIWWELLRRYDFAKGRGDFKGAAVLADSLMQRHNAIMGEMLSEGVSDAVDSYHARKLRIERAQERRHKWYIIIGSCVAVLIVVLLYINKRLQLRVKSEEAANHFSTIIEMQARIEEGDKVMQRMFKNSWKIMNNICCQFKDSVDSDVDRKRLVKEMEREIELLRTPERLKDIELDVNACMNNVMELLRSEIAMKGDSYVMVSLLMAGFKTHAVCMILKISPKSYYQRRTRIVKRIEESDAPHRDWYLQILNRTFL